MRPDLRGACLSASILLLVQLHSIGTKGLDRDLPTESTSDYQQNSGDETVQLDCEALEIRGSRSALSGYINGKYRVGAERMYINKHVAFKKDVSEKEPAIFLLYREARWHIAFLAPGVGKKLTGLGMFDSDVATPRLINGPLLVGGKLDVGVEVVCIDHPLGPESIAPDAHCVREDCSEDDEIPSAHKASTTGNYKRPMDSGNEPPLL
eukprot:m.66802 g.66802  ORF g.66802 m.66802 type:complete len:208 (+) comp9832_c0_seq3:230-853(+)